MGTSNPPDPAPLADQARPDQACPDQICQRCRGSFPGDPTLQPGAIIDWWVCDGCRSVLFGASASTGGAR